MGRTTATVARAIAAGAFLPARSRSGLFPAVAWWAGGGRPLPRYERQAAIIGIVILIVILITIAVAAIHFIRRRR